jgi:hypothetical protein
MTVGQMDKCLRIHKLWNGLHPDIQKALWKDKLNPKKSSYNSVLSADELHEVADLIVNDESTYQCQQNGHEHDCCNNFLGNNHHMNGQSNNSYAGPSHLNNIDNERRDQRNP